MIAAIAIPIMVGMAALKYTVPVGIVLLVIFTSSSFPAGKGRNSWTAPSPGSIRSRASTGSARLMKRFITGRPVYHSAHHGLLYGNPMG